MPLLTEGVPDRQPVFWMHQLDGVTKAPRLDQPEFTAKLKEMLNEIRPPVSQGQEERRP